MLSPPREIVRRVIARIRRDCDPQALTRQHFFSHGHLRPSYGSSVFAIGKAGASMAAGAQLACPGHPDLWPLAVVPFGTPVPKDVAARYAGHPLPTPESRVVGRLVALVGPTTHADLRPSVTLLLSGGASSLMIDPPEEISVESYRQVVQALLLAGASIQELNTVRKHIDFVKGGWLARRHSPMPINLVVLSDVIGDDLSTIGSGPASPDPTTFSDALEVLARHHSLDAAPTVTAWLRAGAKGEHEETPKPGDPCFAHVSSTILANNQTAVDSASETLNADGIDVRSVRLGVTGEAAAAGAAFAAEAKTLAFAGNKRALLWGGETTVSVGSTPGKGGRNQELALAAALEIESQAGITIATFATDGVDGPTDAAGAIVTGDTCRQARQIGLDPAAALARHDSYTLFNTLDKAGFPHLIRTGPTGTNVNDVAIALAY